MTRAQDRRAHGVHGLLRRSGHPEALGVWASHPPGTPSRSDVCVPLPRPPPHACSLHAFAPRLGLWAASVPKVPIRLCRLPPCVLCSCLSAESTQMPGLITSAELVPTSQSLSPLSLPVPPPWLLLLGSVLCPWLPVPISRPRRDSPFPPTPDRHSPSGTPALQMKFPLASCHQITAGKPGLVPAPPVTGPSSGRPLPPGPAPAPSSPEPQDAVCTSF